MTSRVAAVLLASASTSMAWGLDVQGHQGCRGLLPGNSMAAFRKALELRVTTLELDLQVTRDRVLVVFHDPRLTPARCLGADGRRVARTPIFHLDFADLEAVDCGARPDRAFPEQRATAAPIPRFAEVLELASGADYAVRLNVEIKLQDSKLAPPVEEFAELVVGQIVAFGLTDRAVVQSFDPDALRAVSRLDPTLRTSILVRNRNRYDQLLRESGSTILSPKHTDLRVEDVRRLHERGVQIVPWTVNRPAEILRLIEWGVDGIISDYPDRVLNALDPPDADGER